MSHRVLALLAVILPLVATFSPMASAQSVLGPGDDATVPPQGVFRFRVLTVWTRSDERYGLNTPGREPGSPEPLGVDFTRDTLGVQQIEALVPLRTGLRALAGNPALEVSLGRTDLDLHTSTTAVPLAADFGLTNRLAISVNVPIVRTRTEAFFRINPAGREGNLGFNPALSDQTARDAGNALVGQLRTAATTLTNQRAFCLANPTANGCPALNANGAAADALIADATAFANGIAQIYSDPGLPFVPVANSDVDLAIRGRVAGITSGFTSFGVGGITSAGPAAALNVLGRADAQRLLSDPTFGFAADSLANIVRIGVGDIEIAAKLQPLNTLSDDERYTPRGWNIRSAITALVRLGTGRTDSPDNFVDLGVGDGQIDLEVRAHSDLVFGRRFWTSVNGRYGWQLADHRVLRITDPNRPLAEAYRRQRVDRDLGDYWEAEVIPRYVFSEYVAIAGHYSYRNKEQDVYSGVFSDTNTVGEPVTLDASVLNAETQQTEHRAGGGIVYSTLAAHRRGRSRLPVELSYQYLRSIKGSGGKTPKAAQHVIQLRAYISLFGDRRP